MNPKQKSLPQPKPRGRLPEKMHDPHHPRNHPTHHPLPPRQMTTLHHPLAPARKSARRNGADTGQDAAAVEATVTKHVTITTAAAAEERATGGGAIARWIHESHRMILRVAAVAIPTDIGRAAGNTIVPQVTTNKTVIPNGPPSDASQVATRPRRSDAKKERRNARLTRRLELPMCPTIRNTTILFPPNLPYHSFLPLPSNVPKSFC